MAVTGEVNRRMSVEEKGQRAAHTSHIFIQPKQDALCTTCGAVYHNKRWYVDDAALKKTGDYADLQQVKCPACHLIEAGTPAAVITLSGHYLKNTSAVFLTESRI